MTVRGGAGERSRLSPAALPTHWTPVLTALAAVAVLATGTWTAAMRMAVHQCMSADGPIGVLGVRLMLLRTAADCPDGTLAVTPGLPQGAVLAFSLVLPVLAAHAALGVLGLGLVTVVARALRGAARVLRAVLPHLPRPARLRPTSRVAVLVADRRPALPSGAPGIRHPLRGPPLALA